MVTPSFVIVGGTPLLVDHDVAATWPEGHLDDVGEGIDTPLQRVAGIAVEGQDLRHTGTLVGRVLNRKARAKPGLFSAVAGDCGYFLTIARTSRAERIRYSSAPYFTSVPPYLEKITV